ncbi:hypothetical protein BH10BAC1_BH10BAC1_01380 [soil metagenome]
MTYKLTILLLFISLASYSQTGTVKVAKPIGQDQMTAVVTLAGLYYGTSSLDKILKEKKLKLSNNSKLKIIDFNVGLLDNAMYYEYTCQGDTLSQEVIKKLIANNNKKLRLTISPIRARTSGGDTLFLNPIEIKITN